MVDLLNFLKLSRVIRLHVTLHIMIKTTGNIRKITASCCCFSDNLHQLLSVPLNAGGGDCVWDSHLKASQVVMEGEVVLYVNYW